ncbi:ATP-binding protein [Blastococcus aggregatus]|uniref:ATP-binding protein n=1 Tax=Blastococcus aggregatus TaxID=38502 RepID=UPI002481BB36|nr:ATP-binding protein [Blastococcus aggregatus]
MSRTRRQLSAVLHDDARPGGVVQSGVERLLLCCEELASNALRHGRPPARVQVVSNGRGWLIEVSDADPDSPPVPAADRDPAHGGLGLYMVARVSAAHGWWVADDRKNVWAQIDGMHAEEPDAGARSA